MDGHLRNGVVEVGGNARQQFHDARGYGRPAGGNEIRLARVEAAHLLLRGDLTAVVDHDGSADRLSFAEFFVASAAAAERFALRFLVYADTGDSISRPPARAGPVSMRPPAALTRSTALMGPTAATEPTAI